MTKGSAIKYTQEQLDFIQFNCSMDRKSLAEKVNTIFGTTYSVDQIKSLCTRKKWNTGRTGYFQKGSTPPNKGTKGLTSTNKQVLKKVRLPGIKSLLDMNVFVQKMGMS